MWRYFPGPIVQPQVEKCKRPGAGIALRLESSKTTLRWPVPRTLSSACFDAPLRASSIFRSPSMRVWPGRPYPLGATWDGRGVNMALYSENATKVELCLFDSAEAAQESARVDLPEQTDLVWHGYFPDLRPGNIYGFRVHGPFEPDKGHRFNPHKVLLDPYAKTVVRAMRWGDELFGYKIGDKTEDLSFDDRDNAASAPLAAVVDPSFTWGDDRAPRTPSHK